MKMLFRLCLCMVGLLFCPDARNQINPSKMPIPSSLLDKLQKAIEYALDSGAAAEISRRDLYHAHVITQSGKKHLDGSEEILLHAQEESCNSAENCGKRNVVLRSDGCRYILPCELGRNWRRNLVPPGEFFCTVDEGDLGMTEFATIHFVPAQLAAPGFRREFRKNTRTVRGRKVIFFIHQSRGELTPR